MYYHKTFESICTLFLFVYSSVRLSLSFSLFVWLSLPHSHCITYKCIPSTILSTGLRDFSYQNSISKSFLFCLKESFRKQEDAYILVGNLLFYISPAQNMYSVPKNFALTSSTFSVSCQSVSLEHNVAVVYVLG